MAAIVLADVQAIAPEITAIPALILSWVNGNGLNPAIFDGEAGDTTKLVRIYLAAHLTTLIGAASQTGAIVSESEGGISRSYAQASGNTELGATGYGVQARLLMRLYAGGAWLAQ